MKTLLLLLFIAAVLPAQCLDNCDTIGPSCTPCHFRLGRFLFQAEGQIICADCDAPPPPQGGGELLSRMVDFLRVERRRPAISAELHIQLMQRALQSRKDGPELGRCVSAFRSGTREKLQAEIDAIRRRLASASVLYIGRQ